MSFIDDIVNIGSSVKGYLTGNGIGNILAKTVVTGLVLNQVSKSINRDNNQDTPATRQQVEPDPKNKVPVIYGRALSGGIVTDAVLDSNNTTMYFVFTLSEVTGNLNLGAGSASEISIEDVYWNDQKLIFQSDGITVDYGCDVNGGEPNTKINGLIKVYFYNNGSSNSVVPTAYTNTSLEPAYNVMPNWTSNHTMNDLVFAIVRIDYNKEKDVTSLGEFKFRLNNTMYQAGDCLYDYMTNTRYGAGIASAEIYAS
jgi:hypothetical protein